MALFSEPIERLTDALEQMAPRDRSLVLLLSAAVILFVSYFGSTYISRRVRQAEEENRDLIKKLEQIAQLEAQFNQARQKVLQLENQIEKNPVSLVPFLDQLSQKHKVTIDSMTPITAEGDQKEARLRERAVRISMSAVPLASLAQFFDGIENSGKIVKVRQMTIKPNFTDPTKPDVDAVVASYEIARN